MSKQWIITPRCPEVIPAARRWGVPPLVAQLMINRGVNPGEQCKAFLTPQVNDLHPPHLLGGASDAASMIVAAIESGTRIVLYGDYDVDGTTGVAILWHVLKLAGSPAHVRCRLPSLPVIIMM